MYGHTGRLPQVFLSFQPNESVGANHECTVFPIRRFFPAALRTWPTALRSVVPAYPCYPPLSGCPCRSAGLRQYGPVCTRALWGFLTPWPCTASIELQIPCLWRRSPLAIFQNSRALSHKPLVLLSFARSYSLACRAHIAAIVGSSRGTVRELCLV